MKPIILASTSPRRREILAKTRLRFRVVASDYKENMISDLSPSELAKFLSRGKVQAIAHRFRNHIIIGADTFVALRNDVLGKPHTAPTAKKMLRSMSGKTVSIITGFTVIDTGSGKTLSRANETKVYFKKFTNEEINNYVKSKEPLDKAGAFAIQGLGAALIKKIEGDYFNALGLPLYELIQTLKKFGINVL